MSGKKHARLPLALMLCLFVATQPGCKRSAKPSPTRRPADEAPSAGSLILYCGAGLQPAVSEIVERFEQEAGVRAQCDYAGSGVLISRLKLRKEGDLYLPGDIRYVELAEKEGLIAAKRNACYFVPVILVKEGNPKGIRSLQDLAKPGIRLGLGNPEACAIGKLCLKLFEKNGVPLEKIEANTVFSSVTVNELGIQVRTGHADAAIVWDAVATYYSDGAEAIPIPAGQNIISTVGVGVLKFTENRELADRFVDFLTGESGKAIFRKHNFTTSLP